MKRRLIDFRSAAEVIQDIDMLRSSSYEKLGNWNLTQICEHLTGTMNGGMDGFGFRLPWVFRVTVLRWGFRYALKKRKLGRGFPTFKMLRPSPSGGCDDDVVIDKCIETCERAAMFSGTLADYALLDNLSVKDWQEFMWIHASHHLSFLVPSRASTTTLS